MAGTMVAVFADHNVAEAAAEALRKGGISFNDISLVRKGAGGAAGHIDTDRNHPDEHEEEYLSHRFREVASHDIEEPLDAGADIMPRAVAGIVAGVSFGVLLVATSVVIPGMGAVIAAGPLAAFIGGSTAGGVVGGLVGALTAGGVPTQAAQFYHNRVAGGDTLVTVLTGRDHIILIEQILGAAGGHDVRFFPRLIDSMQSIES